MGWFLVLFVSVTPLSALDYTIPYYPWEIDTCDVNNDGYNDLIIIATGGLGYMQSNGDGTFAPYTIIVPGDVHIVACCPLDNVAGDDIIVLRCYSGDEPIQYEFYYNGNFSEPIIVPFSGEYTLHHTFDYAHGDFNDDGLEDIVLTGFVEISTNRVFWCCMYNLGNNQFSLPTYTQCVYSAYGALAVGDFNEDNLDDVAFTISSVQIYYSTGSGFYNYEALPASHCGGILAIDFDQDGDKDLVTNAWEGGSINHHFYLENVPGDLFTIHDYYYVHYASSTIISADLNNDAYPDIACTPGGSQFGVFINLHDWTMEQYAVTFPYYGENKQHGCLSRIDNNSSFDIVIARDTAIENNLTILYNDGTGNFLQTPVSNQDEVIPSINSRVQCYPNPCRDYINFKTNSDDTSSSYTIYNIKGQAVKHMKFPGQEFQWDLADDNGLKLESGMYLLRSRNQQGDYVSKFIIQK